MLSLRFQARFLTTKTYPGDSKRCSCILWIFANSYQFFMACAVVFLLVLDSTTDVTVTTSAYWYSELVLTCIWSTECAESQSFSLSSLLASFSFF